MVQQGMIFGKGLVVLMALMVLGSGCGGSEAIRLNRENDGGQVTVKKGETVSITLDSNPSTGYQWTVLESDPAILEPVGEAKFTPTASTSSTPLVGAGGQETLRFKTIGSGQVDLKLAYCRPWEEGVEPAETFSVQVMVY